MKFDVAVHGIDKLKHGLADDIAAEVIRELEIELALAARTLAGASRFRSSSAELVAAALARIAPRLGLPRT